LADITSPLSTALRNALKLVDVAVVP
jgi:hypothetical protein